MLGGKYELDMPSLLLKILKIPGMDKGDRGELVAEVILLKAYDSAFTRTVAQAKTKPAISTRSSTSSSLVDSEQTRAVKLLTYGQLEVENTLETNLVPSYKSADSNRRKIVVQQYLCRFLDLLQSLC